MKYAVILSIIAGAACAESNNLALSLPNPPLNYQSDRFRAGNLDCARLLLSAHAAPAIMDRITAYFI